MFYLVAVFKTHLYSTISDLAPATVEAGGALEKTVQEPALCMGVVTTEHLMSRHMGFMESVPMLLLR